MQFEVYRLRKEGRLLPHHLRWAGAVRGDLYVKEEHDDELNRVVKNATIVDPTEDTTDQVRAFQQSWILIPFDMLSATDRMRR